MENKNQTLLIITPERLGYRKAIIDEYTIKVFHALKNKKSRGQFTSDGYTSGLFFVYHKFCVCGRKFKDDAIELANGMITNEACVHYLAYHRDEVPEEDLVNIKENLNEDSKLTEGEDNELTGLLVYNDLEKGSDLYECMLKKEGYEIKAEKHGDVLLSDILIHRVTKSSRTLTFLKKDNDVDCSEYVTTVPLTMDKGLREEAQIEQLCKEQLKKVLQDRIDNL